MNYANMTVKELREYAAQQDINLQGRDKKADIVATIKAAEKAAAPKVILEGQMHMDAAAKDRAACEKAMK